MNEKKAKLLRKKVYGVNNYRVRSYYEGLKTDIKKNNVVVAVHVTVVADQLRQLYQQLKRLNK